MVLEAFSGIDHRNSTRANIFIAEQGSMAIDLQVALRNVIVMSNAEQQDHRLSLMPEE